MSEESKYAQITPQGLELATRLERFCGLPLNNRADVEAWDEERWDLEAWIDAHQTDISMEVPHHLTHYFDDSDIHLKEPSYRQAQEKDVRHFIGQLRGEVPLDEKPWWQFW